MKKRKKEKSVESSISKKSQNLKLKKVDFPKVRIRIIGIGGGGTSIVANLSKKLKNQVSIYAVDSDIESLKRAKKFVKTQIFGQNITSGLGTGSDYSLAEKIANSEREKISKLLKDQDLVIFISCLGGGFGSGVLPEFSRVSKELNQVSIGFFTFPFRFEGLKRKRIAKQSLEKSKTNLSAYSVIFNDSIFKKVKSDFPLSKAFSLINEFLGKNLNELFNVIFKPGLINLDFADFKNIFSQRGKYFFLNTVESNSKNRSDDIIEKLFSDPFLPYNIKAENIILNITGSKDIKAFEVKNLTENIYKFNKDAKIIFGICKDSSLEGKIKQMFLAVGKERKLELTKKKKTKKEKKKVIKKKSKEKKKKISKKIRKTKKKKIKTKKKIEKPKKTNKERKSAIDLKAEREEEELKKIEKETELEIPPFLEEK